MREVHSAQGEKTDGSHAQMLLAAGAKRPLGDTDGCADFGEIKRSIGICCQIFLEPRDAKTIELGDTPVSVSFPPCRLAPWAFNTINDGTMSGPACPIVFCSGPCPGVKGAVWANAGAAPQSKRAMVMQPVRFFMVMSNSLLSLPKRMGRVDGLF